MGTSLYDSQATNLPWTSIWNQIIAVTEMFISENGIVVVLGHEGHALGLWQGIDTEIPIDRTKWALSKTLRGWLV